MWSLFELLPEPPSIKILDIGAAFSETPPYQSLVDAGRAKVIGFEPNKEERDRLNEQYGVHHRFLPNFVGDGRQATFFQTNWALTGSLFEPNTPLLEKFQNLSELVTPIARHTVNTSRLDDIKEIDDVDFIKIDIQGGELAVFRNAPRLLAETILIQTEVEFVELYRNQPMFSDVDTFLRRQGFQFHCFLGFGTRAFKPIVRDNDPNMGLRQQLWSDAVYFRDWMYLDQLSEEKLRKYAVLAHDLLQSFDLAHLVLVELDRRTGGNTAAAYLGKLVGKG